MTVANITAAEKKGATVAKTAENKGAPGRPTVAKKAERKRVLGRPTVAKTTAERKRVLVRPTVAKTTAENKIYKLTQVECKTLNIDNAKYHGELFEIYPVKDSHNIKRYTLKKGSEIFESLFYWHHLIRKTSDSMQFKIAIKDIKDTPFGNKYIDFKNCNNDSWFFTDYVTLTFEKINK